MLSLSQLYLDKLYIFIIHQIFSLFGGISLLPSPINGNKSDGHSLIPQAGVKDMFFFFRHKGQNPVYLAVKEIIFIKAVISRFIETYQSFPVMEDILFRR